MRSGKHGTPISHERREAIAVLGEYRCRATGLCLSTSAIRSSDLSSPLEAILKFKSGISGFHPAWVATSCDHQAIHQECLKASYRVGF